MRGRTIAAVLAAGTGLLAGAPAAAQNQVYDPLPPPGSAYVRFVNAVDAELALRPDFLPSRKLGTAPAQRVSAYFVVEKVTGRTLGLDAEAGQHRGHATFHAEPGSFVTVIVQQPDGPGPGAVSALGAVTVVERTDFNQSRARLAFYNATPACADASLVLDPDGPAVFQGVAPGSARVRTVNPVTAQVRAACNGTAAPVFSLEGLEAGGMYSVWLMLPGGKPVAFLGRDITARWNP